MKKTSSTSCLLFGSTIMSNYVDNNHLKKKTYIVKLVAGDRYSFNAMKLIQRYVKKFIM